MSDALRRLRQLRAGKDLSFLLSGLSLHGKADYGVLRILCGVKPSRSNDVYKESNRISRNEEFVRQCIGTEPGGFNKDFCATMQSRHQVTVQRYLE